MDTFLPSPSELHNLFAPDLPLLESVLRVSIIYVALYFMLRVVLKREAGALGVADMLFLVLLADGVQNAMAKDYQSLPNGIVVAATLVFWDYAFNYAGYRWPILTHLLKPGPMPLITNGRLNAEACRRELLTRDEIMAELRSQGIASIAEVKKAYVEPTGRISALRYDGKVGEVGGRQPPSA